MTEQIDKIQMEEMHESQIELSLYDDLEQWNRENKKMILDLIDESRNNRERNKEEKTLSLFLNIRTSLSVKFS